MVKLGRDLLTLAQPDGQVEQIQVGQLAVQPFQLQVEMANILTRQLQINGRLNRPTPRWQVISYNI
jgi:hypothetical protein